MKIRVYSKKYTGWFSWHIPPKAHKYDIYDTKEDYRGVGFDETGNYYVIVLDNQWSEHFCLNDILST
jgi:hypothetical protein